MIARELSKMFEEVQTLEMRQLSEFMKNGKLVLKGEFVVGLCPKK